MKIGFLPFERVHQQAKDTGSSRIRAYWITKHWNDAEVFRYGAKYDHIVFQKTYVPSLVRIFPGLKILDLCDPDWKSEPFFADCLQYMDGVVTSTEELKNYVKRMTDKPVICIPDRHDTEWYGEPKKHTEDKAKSVAWFGYHTNARPVKMVLPFLNQVGLKMTVYSDYQTSDMEGCTYVKYNPQSINSDLKKHDFLVLPGDPFNVNYRFKSNNRRISGYALGLPVAERREDVMRFIDGKERIKEVEKNKRELDDKWLIQYSVDEWKEFIEHLNEIRTRDN